MNSARSGVVSPRSMPFDRGVAARSALAIRGRLSLSFSGAMTRRRPRDFPRARESLLSSLSPRTAPGLGQAGKEQGKRPCASASLGGGILNLGGSIDFTIWTPPKVKNKPSQTYSTLIECLSSARLVSTHGRDGDTKRETWRGWRLVGLAERG